MRRVGWLVMMSAGMILGLAPGPGTAMSLLYRQPEVTLGAHLNCPYISTGGGTAYLQLSVFTQEQQSRARRPMNVSVVIDRSGSMGSEGKLVNAKASVRALVDQLAPDDILSIVIYDDVVEVVRSAGRVGNKQEVRRLVDEITPRGWTNLGGGMVEGFHQVERNLRSAYANRVILLSDGLANRGITDPLELERIARRYRSRSVSLTTVGVGLEYNENLMVALSENGGGNYYFIEDARNLASVFRTEFNHLSGVVAQNASIELVLGRNVKVRDVIGCESEGEGSRFVIPVGDLSSGEHREFTVVLEIPAGRGSMKAATAQVRYEVEGRCQNLAAPVSVTVYYTVEAAEIEKHRDWETQAKADVAVSTRRVDEAMKALDQGRGEDAAKELSAARSIILASPAAAQAGAPSAVLREQEAKLEGYANTLRLNKDNVAKAKKSIQYDNYVTQKQK